MTQPELPPSEQGLGQAAPFGTTVEVSGSENITLTNASAQRDLTLTQTIHQAPKAKPTLPAHTPHNLPDRTTSAERFVGRIHELDQLKALLAGESSRVYLTGMGGMGKSELAIQHAYESFDFYRGGILRLDARQGLDAMALQVVAFFQGTFPEIVLPEKKTATEQLSLCWSQWPAVAHPPEPILIILDDQQGNKYGYDSEGRLLKGMPPRFRRLITQREIAPTNAKAIDLPLLERQASLQLLTLHIGIGGKERLCREEHSADALCTEVGDLPLALVLLGARLAEQPDLWLRQLLVDLQAKGAEARALQEAHPELGVQRGVAEAMLISWVPLSDATKSLAVLLGSMAPALIPWPLVNSCCSREKALLDDDSIVDAQVQLLRQKLLQRAEYQLYRIHPLVQSFLQLQGRQSPELQSQWRVRYAKSVAHVCRQIPQAFAKKHLRGVRILQPHIKYVAEQLADDLAEEELRLPYKIMARISEHESSLDEASRWSRLCLEQCTKRFDCEHPEFILAIGDHSLWLTRLGRHGEAEPMIRNTLSKCEKIYGLDHPTTVKFIGNLGSLLGELNHTEEAESYMRLALAFDEARYGPNHPNTGLRLNNLAMLLKDANRLGEAEQLMRRALAIVDASCGPNHPDMARGLNNLAALLIDTGRFEEAEQLMRKSILILSDFSEQGWKHPNLDAAISNYKQLLRDMKVSEEDFQLMLAFVQGQP